MTEPPLDQPANQLMEFVVSLITSLLTTGAITDVHLARRAAIETIAAYQARGQDELVTIAQILGFAMTALDNLCLSMAPDLSLSMKLKLRSNANALNRSALHSTQSLEKSRNPRPPATPRTRKQAVPDLGGRQPEPQAAEPSASPRPAPPTATERENQQNWAAAMKKQAAQLRADATSATASQRKSSDLWAEVLTQLATELTQPGHAAQPGMSKTDLMRTTLLSGCPGFPTHLSSRRPPTSKRDA